LEQVLDRFSVKYWIPAKQAGFVPSQAYDRHKLAGMIAIEADALSMVGNQFHHQGRLQKIKQKLQFGKAMNLRKTPEGAMFNGRKLRQSAVGEVRIDMEKFIE
jgi:hypothetical protein